jgi:hypothetical protein
VPNIVLREAPGALSEAPVVREGLMRVKLINPGWGSSGYYSAELLERDGPKVFRTGMHMYVDHPSFSEETDRPERSIRDLAGRLASNAVWEATGPDGPGLYADAKVFSSYQAFIVEKAADIGLSIRGRGSAHTGEAEGRTGTIIDELVMAESVDFVTRAGRGGKILQLLESAREERLAEAEELTANDRRQMLNDALGGRYNQPKTYTWVRDFTDTWVVFDLEGDAPDPGTYRLAYTVEDGEVVLADMPTKVTVRAVYIPVGDEVIPVVDTEEAQRRLAEARNVGQWLESRLHLTFTQLADDMFGDGRLTREERIALSSAIGDGLTAFTAALESSAPQLYTRDLWQEPEATSTQEAGMPEPTAEERLTEATRQRDDLQTQLTEATTQRDVATERAERAESDLRVRDARDHVREALAKPEVTLSDKTKATLVERLSANPPKTTDGALDKDALTKAIEAEVAVFAEALGVGTVSGMGGGTAPNGQAVTEAAIDQRSASVFGRQIQKGA